MALPLRGTAKSGTATNGGDVTLTFDTGADAPLQGDVVILFGGHGVNSATAAGPITAGYTAIHVDANAPDRGAWYKVMGATPDTSVSGEGGGNASDAVAYGCFVLDGSLIDAAIFDQTSVETTQGARVPNAGSITTQTDGAWVIAIGTNSVVDTSRGVPSGYTTIIGNSANDSSDISIDAAYIEKAIAGAEDPPAWSTWASGTAYEITLAIKPAAANDVLVTPGVASLTTSRFTPVVTATANVRVTPGVVSLTTTRFTPTVATPRTATPGVASLSLTSFAPTINVGVNVVPGVASLTTSRFTPVVTATANQRVVPGTVALTTARFTPTVTATANRLVTPGVAALTITRFPPTVSASGGSEPAGAARRHGSALIFFYTGY